MSADAIRVIDGSIDAATSFVAIFGSVSKGIGAEAQKKELDGSFAYLVRQIHPDKVDDSLKSQANDVFIKLKRLRDAAKLAIDKGTYTTPFGVGKAPVEDKPAVVPVQLRSKVGVYLLEGSPFATGNYSTLYRAKAEFDGQESEVLVKLATAPPNNNILDHEAKVLRRFHAPGIGTSLLEVGRFTPTIIDTFMVDGSGGRFRANVMPFVPNLVSCATLLEIWPGGMAPEQAAWVARRVLSQVMAAAMAGVVHTAIVPDHILVDPIKHEPMHIGWAHALIEPSKTGTRVMYVMTKWRHLYPPEVLKKQVPDRRTDLFMAGKTIGLLFGDRAPKEITAVLNKCCAEDPARRYQTGKEAFDEFTRVVRGLWGNEYRKLQLPA